MEWAPGRRRHTPGPGEVEDEATERGGDAGPDPHPDHPYPGRHGGAGPLGAARDGSEARPPGVEAPRGGHRAGGGRDPPRWGREAEIVADLASAGSPNHQLLLSLMKRGATLMGTESPELLLEEYRLVQQVLAAKDPEEAARVEASHGARSRSLLARRDQYIARRINGTLRAGETGLRFVGTAHQL